MNDPGIWSPGGGGWLRPLIPQRDCPYRTTCRTTSRAIPPPRSPSIHPSPLPAASFATPEAAGPPSPSEGGGLETPTQHANLRGGGGMHIVLTFQRASFSLSCNPCRRAQFFSPQKGADDSFVVTTKKNYPRNKFLTPLLAMHPFHYTSLMNGAPAVPRSGAPSIMNPLFTRKTQRDLEFGPKRIAPIIMLFAGASLQGRRSLQPRPGRRSGFNHVKLRGALVPGVRVGMEGDGAPAGGPGPAVSSSSLFPSASSSTVPRRPRDEALEGRAPQRGGPLIKEVGGGHAVAGWWAVLYFFCLTAVDFPRFSYNDQHGPHADCGAKVLSQTQTP